MPYQILTAFVVILIMRLCMGLHLNFNGKLLRKSVVSIVAGGMLLVCAGNPSTADEILTSPAAET
jgi:hypothetical protein